MDEPSGSWYEVAGAVGTEPSGSLLGRFGRTPAGPLTLAVLACLAVAAGGLWIAASASSPRVELGFLPGETGEDVETEAVVLVVDVAGAVRAPGLYRLPAGARVGDAITAAGGFGPGVDAAAASEAINLAAPLSDGQKVVVPIRGWSTGEGSSRSGLVDINRASLSELESLPGIGPVTAGKIIAARTERPFATAQELLERKIVGTATWEKIRDLVTAG